MTGEDDLRDVLRSPAERLGADEPETYDLASELDRHRSAEQAELFAALAAAQRALKPATKTATNPHFRNKYATLADCMEELREPLADNGLCVIQEPHFADGKMLLVQTIAHKSGQWRRSALLLPYDDNMQHLGGSITYARRYMLGAVGLVSEEDDDGETAAQAGAPRPGASRRGSPQPRETAPPKLSDATRGVLQAAAEKGTAVLSEVWAKLNAGEQAAVRADKAFGASLKERANEVDAIQQEGAQP